VVEWSPRGQRPLGGASINAWVKTGRGSFSYWFLNGPHYADAEGRFEMRNLPAAATVIMDVKKDGYLQQCGAEITVQAGAHQLDVQLVPRGDVSDSPDAAPPAPGRHVRGFVYEFTPQGRQPVPRAHVAYMAGPDFDTATTVADEQGRFLLCGLPEGQSVQLGIFAAGREAFHRVPPGPNATVELELK
jgi:hypothetical protein